MRTLNEDASCWRWPCGGSLWNEPLEHVFNRLKLGFWNLEDLIQDPLGCGTFRLRHKSLEVPQRQVVPGEDQAERAWFIKADMMRSGDDDWVRLLCC